MQLLTFSLEIDPVYGLIQSLLHLFAQEKSVGDAQIVGDSRVGSCYSFVISMQLLTFSLEIDPVYGLGQSLWLLFVQRKLVGGAEAERG